MNLCPVLLYPVLAGCRAFLYGSIVSVDWEDNKSERPSLPF